MFMFFKLCHITPRDVIWVTIWKKKTWFLVFPGLVQKKVKQKNLLGPSSKPKKIDTPGLISRKLSKILP